MRGVVVVLAVVSAIACGSRGADPAGGAGSAPAVARDAGVVVDAAPPPPPAPPPRALWTPKLADEAAFLEFSKQLGNERFGKFVIDLHSDAIYYFDVDVYPVHKDFIFQALYKQPKTKAAVKVFDKNYGPNKPDFLMCYLVHHLQQDVWTFAFWDGDLATAEHVRHAYRRMKETFYLGDKVKFRPDSNYQERVAKQAAADVPWISNDQLYQAATYQPFNPGTAVGTLRAVPPDVPESELAFAPDDIVILHTPLADITPVAGIISETFSTPLAHVSLRARGWGIPNIGLREAGKQLAPLVGKTVFFEAKDTTYTVREATADEIAASHARQQAKRHVKVPVADRTTTELRSLEDMRARDVVIYGAKAANLGEIVHAHADGVNVPNGFGVPFAFYFEHLARNHLDVEIAAMLADPAFQKDERVRKEKLAKLREAIVAAPVSPALRDAIAEALPKLTAGTGTGTGTGTGSEEEVGVFVRSSGNAEDLPDFSGAGIYDTIPNVKGVDHVAHAITQVWASVWNLGAYDDRHLYNIDEATVASGVLVQVGVDATAAGVLVTVHPTDPSDDRNYTINAKRGLGMSVVDGRAVPESLIVSWYNHGIRVLSRSTEATALVFDEQGGIHEVPNPSPGKPVLTNAMAIHLVDAAHRITKIFKSTKLDIEWVFAGDALYIVQTRPYLVPAAKN